MTRNELCESKSLASFPQKRSLPVQKTDAVKRFRHPLKNDPVIIFS
ncbi:hypothetical protein B4135_2914 [Caldibacillus debilis]|uniref:Uncharacterized protein n=1 Tax=Caldibacillus debilis TaxID=301148 RepID=A0A150LLP8_9BACI|nr:hypothetical protein B4135_2914 [Caldibacillus debilis]